MCADRTETGGSGWLTGTRNYTGDWPRTPGRLIALPLIRLYQLTLSGFVGQACRHQPTCSEYAFEAIARHGILVGGWYGFRRVLRCNPWGTSGYDPVPDNERHGARTPQE